MRNYSNLFKRAQSWILVFAMVLTALCPSLMLPVTAVSDPIVETVTDGEIVAGNYELTDAEVNLIGSGLLVGDEHTYQVPTADDGLITVDTDSQGIAAADFEGTEGYVWKAVSAKIMVGTELKETVALIDGCGAYTYDGNSFSVVVDYALKLDVDADAQALLLGAPSQLKDGLAAIGAVAAVKGDLAVIETAMPELMKLAGAGIPVVIWGASQTAKYTTDPAKSSTRALNTQMTANGGLTDLSVMINAYNSASSKVQYLIENGAALKAKAEETQAHIANIRKDGFFDIIGLLNESEYGALYLLRDSLDGGKNDLLAACESGWDVLSSGVVKSGLVADDYAKLDSLVSALSELSETPEVKNPLLASTVSVQYNLSMYDVDVKVVLNITDAASSEIAYIEYGSKTTTVTLAEGATEAEILAAISESGIEADAKAEWAGAYVNGQFAATVTGVPAELNEDIEVVISYDPNMYNVHFTYYGTVSYPYGYALTLPANTAPDMVYDYFVDGDYYPQGYVYTVVSDATVVRSAGKPYVDGDLYDVVAGNYLDGKGASVLTSGAIVGDEEINVRYPDNKGGAVTLDGNVLKAEPYDSSYKGLAWIPYSYTLSTGSTYYFNGANEVEIGEVFDSLTVTYRLYLTNYTKAQLLEIVNLPDALAKESAAQLAALDTIAGQKGNLESLKSGMIYGLEGFLNSTVLSEDAEKNAALKACFTEVLNSLKSECLGDTYLYIYDIVTEYGVASDKLYYYYQNYAYIIDQISKFAGYMEAMVKDDETLTAEDKIAALEKLMLATGMIEAENVGNYLSKLTTLESTMNGILADLKVPNSAIDLDSADLIKLTNALQQDGATKTFAALDEDLYLEDSSIILVADNKVVVSVTVQIEGGSNVTIASDALYATAVIDSDTIAKLIAAIESQLDSQGVEGKYYTTNYDKAALEALVGVVAGKAEQTAFTFKWEYADFTVQVPGTADQTVSLDNKVINLPASEDIAYRYDYFINGNPVSNGAYALSDAEFDMVVDGTLVVTRDSVYVLRDNLISYVNSLNASVGNDTVQFVLIEGTDGSFSIVLKVDGTVSGALMEAIQGTAVGVFSGSYPYVGIDGNAFFCEGTVYLQSMVDAIMNSGLSAQTIIDAINGDGSINNMTLSGNVLSNKPVGELGGKLVQTTMELGSNSASYNTVDFYITLGSAPKQLVQVRNLFADELKNRFNFVCDDGQTTLSINLPEKAYEAFLAVLLITEKIDFEDINSVDGEITISFINDHLIPLFSGEMSVEAFENTLSMLGFDINVSSKKGVNALYNVLTSFYTGATFTYDEASGTAIGNIDISSFIDSMDIGDLANLIAEKDSGLSVTIELVIEDLGKDYEAIFFDVDANGYLNKIGLATDLESKLDEIAGTSVIVLVDDVDASLTFNTTTLLNLNGFEVGGDIIGNGKVIVIDSYVAEDRTGTVKGDIYGNVSVVSGKYENNVEAFLKNGYVQGEDGVVSNKFYDIVEDANGNLTVEIDAGLLYTEEMPSVETLVIDLACDLLFNGYSSNYLELEGHTVYDITVDDLVGLYAGSNRLDTVVDEVVNMVDSAELSALINIVLDDVMDFAAIGEAIANGTPVLEYEMVTKPWDIEFAHIDEGDYVTANIVSGEPGTTRTLSVLVVGDDEYKQLLADLFTELGETVTGDLNVNISHGKDGKELSVDVVADAYVYVDFTDPAYSVMFSVILADGLGAPTNAALIDGIRALYEQSDNKPLAIAFNSLTTAQAITALKNFGLNDDFSAMVSRLGLDHVVGDDVAELEALYDRIGKLAAAVVRRADLSGGNRTLGSFLDSDNVYGVTRANLDKFFSANLFRGYGAEASITLTDVYFGVKLFADYIPIDYTELERQIAREEALDESKYTKESWDAMLPYYEDALAALTATSQAEVDAAAEALKNALDALVEMDYTELYNQIGIAGTLDESIYTEDSWTAMEDALADANAATTSRDQAEVDAAAEALKNAIAALVVKLPAFVDDHGNPTVAESDKLADYKVDKVDPENKYIILDTDPNGITVNEFKALLNLQTVNADNVEIQFDDAPAGTARIINGTKFTAFATNENTTEFAKVTYTVIILGDVNCNGRVEVGDAVIISQVLVGLASINEIQTLAADVNNNGRTDIGDATRITNKVVDWTNYESRLNTTSNNRIIGRVK